jgi:hypothetical protein
MVDDQFYKRVLEAIYGHIDVETWKQVADGNVTPPWPLPEVLEAQGLYTRGYREERYTTFG